MDKFKKQMAVRYASLLGESNESKWESSLNKIFSPGCFLVEIDHKDGNLGLPVDFCGSEHYIVGTLVVTDSGTTGPTQRKRVTGQLLIFTSRKEKETKMFTRTHADGTWSTWRTIAQTGMYDDIANADELYASVAELVAANKKNNLELATEITRATEAEKKLAGELATVEKRVQHTIINYNEWKGGNVSCSLADVLADEEFVAIVTNGTIITFKSNETSWKRYQYTSASVAVADITNSANWKDLSGAAFGIKQSVDAGKVQISTTGENGAVKDILNIVAATTEKAGVMTAADKAKLNNDIPYPQETGTIVTSADKKYIYRGSGDTDVVAGLYWQAWPKTVDLRVKKWGMSTNDEVGVLSMLAATSEKAGVMTAEDKKKLDDNVVALVAETARAQGAEAAAIEQGRKLALRDLFVAAGALYNDTGADIIRTAPWGESVTHKDGHYYLNGLGDITEGQMINIYNVPHNGLYEQAYIGTHSQTVFFYGSSATAGLTQSPNGLFMGCTELKVIAGSGFLYFAPNCEIVKNVFRGCTNLEHIVLAGFYGRYVKFEDSVFKGCKSLVNIKITQLEQGLSFADSPQINKESILFIINNAIPKSVITITLHADAYARLAEDAEIVDALDAQPLVSLVSA